MATCAANCASSASQPYAPASRASWLGQLRVGELYAPVKAYSALAAPPETPLRQLHSICGQRIEYRKCCPQHGAVPAEEIVKGYPYRPDTYVRLTSEELQALQPADDKTIHLQRFLAPAQLDLALFAGRALYLVPAHPAARLPFATLRQAIHQSGKWGLGLVVFSGKRQLALVRPDDAVLLLHTLYHPSLRRRWPSGSFPKRTSPPETSATCAALSTRPAARFLGRNCRTIPTAAWRSWSPPKRVPLSPAGVARDGDGAHRP